MCEFLIQLGKLRMAQTFLRLRIRLRLAQLCLFLYTSGEPRDYYCLVVSKR